MTLGLELLTGVSDVIVRPWLACKPECLGGEGSEIPIETEEPPCHIDDEGGDGCGYGPEEGHFVCALTWAMEVKGSSFLFIFIECDLLYVAHRGKRGSVTWTCRSYEGVFRKAHWLPGHAGKRAKPKVVWTGQRSWSLTNYLDCLQDGRGKTGAWRWSIEWYTRTGDDDSRTTTTSQVSYSHAVIF